MLTIVPRYGHGVNNKMTLKFWIIQYVKKKWEQSTSKPFKKYKLIQKEFPQFKIYITKKNQQQLTRLHFKRINSNPTTITELKRTDKA